MKDNTVHPATKGGLWGRLSTDPEVQAEVARKLRDMPFRDLVALIEGEEAALEMERENAKNRDESSIDVMPVVPPVDD